MPDGLRLTFAPSSETLALIAQAIDAERQCCCFLRFPLTVETGEGPMTANIRITGCRRDVAAAHVQHE